jgi:parallel beta helix pectate lyase-like protein
MNSRRVVVTVLLLPLVPSWALARTWHILNDGSGDAPTIQTGIDSAAAGDTVLVGPGTYLVNLSVAGKDLVLRSQAGPDVTVLDGSGRQDAVVYFSSVSRSAELEGFTITGGTGRPRSGVADGGGIYLANQSSPTIRGNKIVNNGLLGTTFFGGGLVAATIPASPLIEDNLFEHNTARLGGAMSISNGEAEVRGNIFRNNSCYRDGGAIYADFSAGLITVEDNQFWNNTAGDHAGAVALASGNNSEVLMIRNLFVSNRADGSGNGDTGSGAGAWVIGVSGSVVNNTFVNGVGASETVCGGGGLVLDTTPANLDVSRNIFAFNRSCAISCRYDIQNVLGPNLFWMNQDGDLGSGLGTCPSAWASNQVFADPLFCGGAVGNFTVAQDSPALTGSALMGVWTTPGCGPGVAVRPSTWGRIKALYR